MATLQKLNTQELFGIESDSINIGRDNDNEIVVDDPTVSGHHALITVRNSSASDRMEYVIEDLESTNHTFVNNIQVIRQLLRNGDILRIGNTRFKFSANSRVVEPAENNQKTKKLLGPGASSAFLYVK